MIADVANVIFKTKSESAIILYQDGILSQVDIENNRKEQIEEDKKSKVKGKLQEIKNEVIGLTAFSLQEQGSKISLDIEV